MTRAAWAERKVEQAQEGMDCCCITCFAPTYAKLILAEHKRAVRVVTAEIKRVKLDRHNYSVVTRAEMTKCLDRLLAALQKGRT